MNLNFGYAKKTGGVCFMRFDDTNPAAEKQEFVDSILRVRTIFKERKREREEE